MKQVAAFLALAAALIWPAVVDADGRTSCAEFQTALQARDTVLEAFQGTSRPHNPVLNRAAANAVTVAHEAMAAARDKVEAALTDRHARTMLNRLVAMMGPASTLDRAMTDWKIAEKRVVEAGLVARPVFPPLDRATSDLSDAIWTVYHEVLKTACALGAVAKN